MRTEDTNVRDIFVVKRIKRRAHYSVTYDVYHRLDDVSQQLNYAEEESESNRTFPISVPSRAPAINEMITTTMSTTNSTTSWQTTHTSRIQSMVVQNDGSIILCDNENDIQTTAPHIEVVEIVSPSNYVHAQPLPIAQQQQRQQRQPRQQRQQRQRTQIERDEVGPTTHKVMIKKGQMASRPNMKKRPKHMMPKQNTLFAQRFACPRCGKDYSQQKNMRRHYRLECGQEPQYPCRICNLRFKRHNQMNGHMLTRHGIKDNDDTNKVILSDGDLEI